MEVLQQLGRGLGVERLGIEPGRCPLGRTAMLVMVGVPEGHQELFVAVGPARVLQGPCHRAAHAALPGV
jgi:hypothetical protein